MKSSDKKNLLVFIFGAILLVYISGFVILGRHAYRYSLLSMSISLFLALILVIAKIINIKNNNYLAQYLEMILPVPAFIGIFMINLITRTLSSWYWMLLIIMMYPFAILLPYINNRLSKRISSEFSSPTTFLGKLFLLILISIAPTAGFIGVWLSKASRKSDNYVLSLSIIGFVFHLFLIWGEMDMSYKGWKLIQKGKRRNG